MKKQASHIEIPDTLGDSAFIGRRAVLKQIIDTIEGEETYVVLEGPGGVGKSVLLARAAALLKKKKFDLLALRGSVSPEIVLKKLISKASEKGIKDVENLFESQIEFKDKLEKVLDLYVYKEKFLLIFEDFDENQSMEGDISDIRLNELITFLKDSLKSKSSRMIFSTRFPIPKFTSIKVEPFSWKEFQEMISGASTLKRLDKKSLKSMFFEMGGYPRAVELLDRIALHEFGASGFNWEKLKNKVPNLSERILHKENESADFSYLLVEALISYLNKNQRDILNTLSIFKGGVTYDMIKAQRLEITPAQRAKLEKSGLLFYSKKTGEYHIPRLIARTALNRMEERELKARHRSAADFFKSLEGHQVEARDHYIEAEDLDNACDMMFESDRYLCKIGYPQYAFDLMKGMEKYAPELMEANQIQLHNRLAIFYSIFGKLDEAIVQNEKSLKLAQAADNTVLIALNLWQLGLLYEAKGKDDEALEFYKKALDATEKNNSQMSIVQCLEKIGLIQKRQGNYNEAFDNYRQALKINRENNDQKAIGANLEQLGRIHDEQMKFDEALEFYQKSLEIKETLSDQQGIAELVHQMGNVNFVKGNIDESLSLYQRSLSIKEEINDAKGAGYSLGQIGLIFHRKGRIDDALSHYEKSVEYFEKADEQKGIAAGNHQIGRIYESKGDNEKALSHYEKAVEIREKTGDMLGAALTYGQLGMLFFNKEEFETAMRYSTKAYSVFSNYGSPNVELVRKNMLRIKPKLPQEIFENILKEFNINTAPPSQQENAG